MTLPQPDGISTMLTDTQLVLLSAAAQRDDGLLSPPEHLKGGARRATIAKLLAHNLVAEVSVSRDQPAWREDAHGGLLGFKITTAGLHAIGIETEPTEPVEIAWEDACAAPSAGAAIAPIPSEKSQPRSGTKQALILDLLARPEGAHLADLTHATGWLPHTARAALTGLRQRGHDILRSKDESGTSVYRLHRSPPIDAGDVTNGSEVA